MELAERLPPTIHLAVAAALISTTLGIVTGVLSAVRRQSLLDVVSTVLAIGGVSVPIYWLGLVLILVCRPAPVVPDHRVRELATRPARRDLGYYPPRHP
jgi:ABC-type dipeptide/oligopeptide/nickel transport system permease component